MDTFWRLESQAEIQKDISEYKQGYVEKMVYKRVLFLGSKRSGLKVLLKMAELRRSAIVACITIDDRSDSRSAFLDIVQFCERESIPLEVVSGTYDIETYIQNYAPDICFVMGWYHLIKMSVIKQVAGGFIGIHNSLLPSYRGFAPVVWAMINGEKNTGFSVFSFGEGMDTGDLWYQKVIDIDVMDYIGDVLKKIDDEIEVFLNEKYEMILEGLCNPYSQKNVGITYGAKRNPEDGHIEWGRDADTVYNFIRAQSKPYSGAFTYYNNKKIVIWEAKKFEYPIYGSAGQVGVIDKKKEYVVIVCGEHTGILLEELDIDGQIWKAVDYIKTYQGRFD